MSDGDAGVAGVGPVGVGPVGVPAVDAPAVDPVDVDLDIPTIAKAGSNDQLQALTKQLEAAQGKQAKQDATDDSVMFGLSFGALMVGLVLSTIGVGFFRYARVVGEWSFAILGAALFFLPFVFDDAVVLAAVGGGVIAAVFVVRRFVTF